MPYTSLGKLGSGFFGEVFLERDDGLNRLCAAKYLRVGGPDRFAEAQAMLAVEHENIVKVFSADDDAATGKVIIRMEFHTNGSLQDIQAGRPENVGIVVRRIEQACRGLQHLHNDGRLHRDIKPANMLVSDNGSIKLSDFGLCLPAVAVGASPPMGYVAHLPPEAITGPGEISDVAGDIFAMGVTLRRLMEGDGHLKSMRASGANVMQAIVDGKFPSPRFAPHIHDKLRRVARKATHFDPSRRFASASEMRHALEQARPRVAWSVSSPTPGVIVWDGIGDDGTEWRSCMETDAHRRSSFLAEKRLPGKSLRQQHALDAIGLNGSDAYKHACSALGGVAEGAIT